MVSFLDEVIASMLYDICHCDQRPFVFTTKVENIVAICEIARFEQFLILSQCFQKSSAADAPECVYKWKRINALGLQINVRR